MTTTNTPDALRLADKADSLAASLDKHARGWNDRMAFSEAMRCQADATEFRKCAAELRLLHAEVERLRQGGEAVPPEFDVDVDGDLNIDFSPQQGQMLSIAISPKGFISWAVKWGETSVHGSCTSPGAVASPPLQADACKVPQASNFVTFGISGQPGFFSAAPKPEVGINGLTEAETEASASVIGLSKHFKQAPKSQCMNHGECFGGECIYPPAAPTQVETQGDKT